MRRSSNVGSFRRQTFSMTSNSFKQIRERFSLSFRSYQTPDVNGRKHCFSGSEMDTGRKVPQFISMWKRFNTRRIQMPRAHKLTWGVMLFQLITSLYQLPTKDHPHMFWTQSNWTWSCNKPFFFGGPLIPFVGFLPRVSKPGWIPPHARFIASVRWIYQIHPWCDTCNLCFIFGEIFCYKWKKNLTLDWT